MFPPFHHNKLESIGEQLAAGGTVEAIAASQHCSERSAGIEECGEQHIARHARRRVHPGVPPHNA